MSMEKGITHNGKVSLLGANASKELIDNTVIKNKSTPILQKYF